jgi:membrane protein
LQDALNTIWGVAPKPGRGIGGFIRDRILSFTMVAGVCFLLLVSLVVSAGLAAMSHFLGGASHSFMHYVWIVVDFLVSIGVVSLLFAMMYKVLPDVKMSWRDVWIGAIATAVLFGIGKWAIGTYLGRTGVSSTYGAIGSAVVLLLWVYYSSQIFLLGAEFTQVYANRLGSEFAPSKNAVPLTDEMRAHQGIPRQERLEEAVAKAPTPDTSDVSLRPQPKQRRPAAEHASQPGRMVPAALAFAAGFVASQMRQPKVKRLIIAPDLHVVPKPTPASIKRRQQAVQQPLLRQFTKGWERGVKKH